MIDLPSWIYRQSAVIPFKIVDSKLKILLITSHSQKKWVIPKGIIEEHLSAQDSAVKEALEEAGIEGKIFDKSLGKYKYEKWGGICHVEVFPLQVEIEHDNWPEMDFRKRKWFTVKKAVKNLNNSQFKKIFKNLIKIVENIESK